MKKKLADNTQLKFSFERTENRHAGSASSNYSAKIVKFDPKAELYRKILNRK